MHSRSTNRRRIALPRLQVVLTSLLITVFVAAVCYLNFSRHFVSGMLDSDGMDLTQSARLLARTGKFSTDIVRPLLTSQVSVNGDGTSPDFAHAPLYPLIVAAAQRATHQTGAGQGDREGVLISVGLYFLCIGATAFLAHMMFGSRLFGRRVMIIATLFFALAGTASAQSLQVRPTMLSALLFTLLVCLLYKLDVRPAEGDTETAQPLSFPLSALAGVLFGLLYLSLYSALILLPIIAFHVYRINNGGRRGVIALGFFLLLFVMVSGPLLARNERLAHNPLYNSRLLDLVENTDTNPGYSLLGMSVAPRTLSQYLAGGGVMEIASKAGRNLAGFYADVPVVLGLFALPLFLLSALTRFRDSRVNRSRNVTYVCIAAHMVGLAPFQPFAENSPLFLIYGPISAVIAAGFLLSLVKARNLPAFYANAIIGLWTGFACLPGLGQILAPRMPAFQQEPYRVYKYLDTSSSEMVTLRASHAYMISDVPWEAAFRLDVPVVWLPRDGADMAAITERTGRPIAAVVLTPDVGRHNVRDPSVGLWVTTYNQIAAVTQVAAGLNASLSKSVLERSQLFYPAQLSAEMISFKPEQVAEVDRTEFSLVFWDVDAMSSRKPAAAPPRAESVPLIH